jgi:hypothetical protein
MTYVIKEKNSGRFFNTDPKDAILSETLADGFPTKRAARKRLAEYRDVLDSLPESFKPLDFEIVPTDKNVPAISIGWKTPSPRRSRQPDVQEQRPALTPKQLAKLAKKPRNHE